MNNDELKKKIVEIIINAIWKDAEADYDSTDETEAGSIADALIEAGIGNVKETERRAEVAEKALNDCVEYYSYSALCPVLDCNYNKACWRKECTSDIAKCFKIQAEKELAEEGKDE